MSQHYIETTLDNEKVVVLIGWDRPLSGFFMVVTKPYENIDEEGDQYPDEDYLYSNLEDFDLGFGLANHVEYFKQKLVEIKISLPEEIFSIVRQDGEVNAGNKVQYYIIVDGVLEIDQ